MWWLCSLSKYDEVSPEFFCNFILTCYTPKFWNYGILLVLYIASAKNNAMEFIKSKNLEIVYLLTLRVMEHALGTNFMCHPSFAEIEFKLAS